MVNYANRARIYLHYRSQHEARFAKCTVSHIIKQLLNSYICLHVDQYYPVRTLGSCNKMYIILFLQFSLGSLTLILPCSFEFRYVSCDLPLHQNHFRKFWNKFIRKFYLAFSTQGRRQHQFSKSRRNIWEIRCCHQPWETFIKKCMGLGNSSACVKQLWGAYPQRTFVDDRPQRCMMTRQQLDHQQTNTFGLFSCPVFRRNIYRKVRSFLLLQRNVRRFNNKLSHEDVCFAFNENNCILQATSELFSRSLILTSKPSRDQMTSSGNTFNDCDWSIYR